MSLRPQAVREVHSRADVVLENLSSQDLDDVAQHTNLSISVRLEYGLQRGLRDHEGIAGGLRPDRCPAFMFREHGHFANGLDGLDGGHRDGIVSDDTKGSRKQDVHLVARSVVGADYVPLFVNAGATLAQDPIVEGESPLKSGIFLIVWISAFFLSGDTIVPKSRASVAGAREHVNDGGNPDEIEDVPPEEVRSPNGENARHDPFFFAARSVNSLSGQRVYMSCSMQLHGIITNTISSCHRYYDGGARDAFAYD